MHRPSWFTFAFIGTPLRTQAAPQAVGTSEVTNFIPTAPLLGTAARQQQLQTSQAGPSLIPQGVQVRLESIVLESIS